MRKSLKVFVVFTVLATVLAIPGVALAHHTGITAVPDCVNANGTWDFTYTVSAATDSGASFEELHNSGVEVRLLWNGVRPGIVDQTTPFTAANSNSFTGAATAPAGTAFVIIAAIPGEWNDDDYKGPFEADIRSIRVARPDPCPFDNPGTGTPGYWHKIGHWADEGIRGVTIGGVDYSAAEAIAIINMPVKGDKTLTMFPALVAAKLNVMIGNDDSCISATIGLADRWMRAYPPESGVKANTRAWKIGEPFYKMLDQYNNGYLCAPHRD
jgi:hypothetical protein